MTNKKNPRITLFINDTSEFGYCSGFYHILPLYYDFDIQLSPYVLQRFIQWLTINHYIVVNGELIIPISNRKAHFNDTGEKEDTQT